ncbi:unnamed protein product [Phytomonas sp. Hart1]|nr:unnamed protein product [Phytomonas sp. Hart1]|eukprot:CCW68315.1 unnamed protein product [Phytomonas sp. isolate Hart1]
MRAAKLPPHMAVSKLLPDRHYIITTVDSCASYQRFSANLTPPRMASMPSLTRPNSSLARQEFSVDDLVPEDLTHLLVLCRSVTHPRASINFSFQGIASLCQGSVTTADTLDRDAVAPPQRDTVENLFCMHIVERVKEDFVTNNLIYDCLKWYKTGPGGSPRIDGFTELLQQTRSQGAQSAAEAQMALGVSPSSPAAATPEAKFEQDPLSRDAEARAKSDENVKISLTLPNAGSIFTFYPFSVSVEACIPYRSEHFCVMVNLKPILPYHLMVVPLRCVGTIHGLTEGELKDWGETMALTLRVLNEVFNRRRQGDALLQGSKDVDYCVAIQQGSESGQTVPHLHTHIIPFQSPEDLGSSPDSDESQIPRVAKTNQEMGEETTFLKTFFAELRDTLR